MGDETAVVNTDVRGCSYAPKGYAPVTYALGIRQKLSMISTVTNQGKARWIIIEENFGADRLIEFLEALIKDADRKIFHVLDNLRAHHSKLFKAWLETRKDQIEIFYLPRYSPELNPDERLNADLRQAIGSTVPARTKAKLKAATENHMSKLATTPIGSKPSSTSPLQLCCVKMSPCRINRMLWGRLSRRLQERVYWKPLPFTINGVGKRAHCNGDDLVNVEKIGEQCVLELALVAEIS
jgi:transposase